MMKVIFWGKQMKYTFNEQEALIRGTPNHLLAKMPVEDLILVRLMTNFTTIYKTHRAVLLQEYGFSETQFLALTLIYYQKDRAIQPSVLSEMLGSSRTNITRVSDELEQKGWIERQSVLSDRRAYLLKLTSAGIKCLETFLPHQWQFIRHIFSILTPEENQFLQMILRKLTNHIEHIK